MGTLPHLFSYRIEHVPGSSNIRPVIMTIWMHGYRNPQSSSHITHTIPLASRLSRFKVALCRRSRSIAKVAPRQFPVCCAEDKLDPGTCQGGSLDSEQSYRAQVALLTISHVSNEAHLDADPTCHAVRKEFFWDDQHENIRYSVSSCLLWMLAKICNKVLRPMSTAPHASNPKPSTSINSSFSRATRTRSMWS